MVLAVPRSGGVARSCVPPVDDSVTTPTRTVIVPKRPEIEPWSAAAHLPQTDLKHQIATAGRALDRYLSDLRTYNGMFSEVHTLLHAIIRHERPVESLDRALTIVGKRVRQELREVRGDTAQRFLPDILNYQLHRALNEALQLPGHGDPHASSHHLKALLRFGEVLRAHSDIALDERCIFGVSIREVPTHRGLLNPSVVDRLVHINQRLVIDRGKLEPQSGFGRVLDHQEMWDLLTTRSSRLFLFELRGEIAGYYILHTSLDSVGPHLSQALSHPRLLRPHHERWGCAMIAGILPEARREIETRCPGVKAYDLLDAAVAQSARAHKLDGLFGEVREGPQGNLAKRSHERCQWKGTGVVYHTSLYPYEVLERSLTRE